MSSPTHLTLVPPQTPLGIHTIHDSPWTTLGSLHPDAATIQVGKDLLSEIIDYSERDYERETGGFLLGAVSSHQPPHVRIRHFLPAIDARSQSARLTFTHETWATMNRQAEQHFPDDVIIGWQHTHPNLGIFLSAYDLFIHRHFFRQPWHIALVVDPVRKEFGFFQWRDNEIVDCGFMVEE